MASLSAREELAARYECMAANDGLVDVKFFLGNAGEATSEQVAREVNALYCALERGECEPLDFGDRSI